MRSVVRHAALAVALAVPVVVRAQGAGTTLIVGVADAESGTALENALVRLPTSSSTPAPTAWDRRGSEG